MVETVAVILKVLICLKEMQKKNIQIFTNLCQVVFRLYGLRLCGGGAGGGTNGGGGGAAGGGGLDSVCSEE